ncbi:phospholipase A2 inhibitor gamma subunit B-like [Elgaria multicarinata webbii]|uniref:phospholipase A2 inhibitor gamma subunit B-like n=1 Tax=Elgaria multicarinata webbii TaxID=159646 RepID=UPI002FCD221D
MRTLLGHFLTFVLLTTGASLRCEVCYEIGHHCTSPLQTCPPNKDTCVVAYTESTLDGKMIQTVEKGCESSDICSSVTIELYLGHSKFYRAFLACCNEETCGNVSPKLPTIQKESNGKQCPACFSWADGCTDELVNCTGTETHCFEVASRTYFNEIHLDNTIKGCTTRSVCASMRSGNSIFGGADYIKTARCTPNVSRGSQSNNNLLLTVSGLFLLKIHGEMVENFLKGCTSLSACESINHARSPLLGSKVLKAKCMPGIPSRGSQFSGLLLPTISGLLLRKIVS